jgi:Uma2 family endonuclease
MNETLRRFTAEEVRRMVDAGILDEDEPVELIDGALIVMSPQGPLHRSLAVVIHDLLHRTFGDGFHVQDHSPVDAGPDSLPEPDVAVVRGAPRDYVARLPTSADVPLVVEVSVTSHRADEQKASDYAAGGFAEYWQVLVPERRLVVRTSPAAREYRSVRIYVDGETVAVAAGAIAVADLLP